MTKTDLMSSSSHFRSTKSFAAAVGTVDVDFGLGLLKI